MENSSEIPAHGIYRTVKHFLHPVTLRKMELFKVKIATQRRSISTVDSASDLRQALNKSVYAIYEQLAPVVQSFVSLTKSLVSDSLSLLVHLTSSVLIFFAEKMWGAFALQKLLTFFRQKMAVFLYIICLKF